MTSIPLLIETDELQVLLDDPKVLIIDTSSTANHLEAHIPGAVHIPPAALQCGIKPATGKIPSVERLSERFSTIGLQNHHHVVAYDDEGGGWAGRLCWTLEAMGHHQYSLLNGGRVAWINEARAVSSDVENLTPSQYALSELNTTPIAEIDDILPHIGEANFGIWDARSAEEHSGSKVLAARGGHIPAAAHLNWTDLMDRSNHLRLLPLETIQAMLDNRGLSKDKSIVTHCQSHHRSGLTWFVGKLLGYNIKAYHGSWGEWGNNPALPVETDFTE